MEYSTSKMAQAINNDVYDLIKWDYPGIIGIESATSYWGYRHIIQVIVLL